MNQPLKQAPSLRDRIVEVLREHHEVKHIGGLADKLEAALSAPAQDTEGRERAKRAFEHGYVIACCNLVHLHDEPGLAFDVLSELGVKKETVTAMCLTDYDNSALRQIEEARSSQQLYAPQPFSKEEPAL